MNDRISTTAARAALSDVVNRVAYGGEHIGLTVHDTVRAVLIPAADYELLERIQDVFDAATIERIRSSEDGGYITAGDLAAALAREDEAG